MSDNRDDSDAERAWFLTVYELAVADTRWAKEQSWRVVQWLFALFGAVLTLYRYPFARAEPWSFAVIVLTLGAVSAFYLWQLHAFAASARVKSSKIDQSMPSGVRKILGERGRDPSHTTLLVVQLAALVLSCVLTIKGLWWIHAGRP